MSYLVLARKYRPLRFADMVGQEHVTRTLTNAIHQGRVHHAYLFCGVRGLGKTTVARVLAKCLVCEHGPTPDPCNVCEQCRMVTEGRSVDVIEIDGASNNSVDDIRALRDQVQYLPQSARRKIYIIDEVHMLTAAAFNALLKTLEEPPPHVTFLFATTDPQKVLPTILSRVSRLDLRRVATKPLVEYLETILAKEGVAIPKDGLLEVARAADGSVRDSLTLLDKILAFASDPRRVETEEVRQILGVADRRALAELVGAVLARDAVGTLRLFDEIDRGTSDVVRVALGILQHLRDLCVVKATGRRDVLVDASETTYETLEAQAARVSLDHLAQCFDRFARAVERLEHGVSPRLVVEMALLDLVHAPPLEAVGTLLARLDALADGGATSVGRAGPSGGGRGEAARSGRPETLDRPRTSAPREARAQRGEESTRPEPVSSRANPRHDDGPRDGEHDGRRAAERRDDDLPSARHASHDAAREHEHEARGQGGEGGLSEAKLLAELSAITRDPPRGGDRGGRSTGAMRHDRASPVSAPKVEAAPHHDRDVSTTAATREPPAASSASAADERAAAIDLTGEVSRFLAHDAATRGEAHASDAPEPSPSEAAADAARDGSEPDDCCPGARPRPEPIAWPEHLDASSAYAVWREFGRRLKPEDPIVFLAIAEAGLVELRDDHVTLAIGAHSIARDRLRDPEVRARLDDAFRRELGRVLTIELVDREPDVDTAPSLHLRGAIDEEKRTAHLEDEGRTHPAIRSIVERFSAVIKRVEVLPELDEHARR